MRRPLGCFTFSALVAAILAVVAIVGAAAMTGNGIFSPGQLSGTGRSGKVAGLDAQVAGVTSHADLAARCDACHAPAWSGEHMGDRCLACHTQVKQEIASKGALHGRLLATTTSCRNCHTDHRGAAATLTLADPRIFPHDQTGYALASHQLRGQGGNFGCLDCHPGSPLTFALTTTVPATVSPTSPTTSTTDTAPTSTCVACHQKLDRPAMTLHQKAFGTTCLNCHDGKETYGKSFDHATYPLTGGHDGVLCSSCHSGATTLTAARATSTECISCHAAKDIHEGRLGTSCAECHTPANWTDATIDHDRTRFALVGQHVGALCESCHVDRHWTGIGTTCRTCHAAADPHRNQFPGDCATCHVATGWKTVTFDHATTRFALTFAHATPACVACHAGGKYVGTPTTCSACHAKPATHASSAFAGVCSSCHKTKAWLPATFNHTKTAFPLTGAHLSVTCRKCHVGGVLKGTPTTCSACHAKPSTHASSAFAGVCSTCHKTKAWLPATFNHTKTAFPLTGAHLAVTCRKCHVGGVLKGTPTTCSACHAKPSSHGPAYAGVCSSCHKTKAWLPATFNHAKTAFPLTGAHLSVTCRKCHVGGVVKGTPTACSACHAKPSSHGAAYAGVCSSCHTTKAWLPATFNHAKTAFPLTGAHLSVTCQKCHVGGVLKGTPTTCSACHARPSSHGTAMAGVCSSCHTTRAWLPASFNGPHLFPQNHQGAGGTCSKCHPSSLTSYSCASCHSNAKMTDKHKDEKGFSLTTCVKCHPTGKQGD